MIQAVFFDLDETLIDRAPAIRAFVVDQYARCASVLEAVPLDRYRDTFLDVEQFGRIPKKTVYPELATKLGLPESAAKLLLDDYTEFYPRYATLRPEAKPAVEVLHGMGVKLGVITNGVAEVQYGKLDAIGLRPLFEVVLISSIEGISKPDAEIFLRAARRIGQAESACLYVGDNPRVDIIGAEAAGMPAAWLENQESPWPAEVPPPRRVLATLADVVPLVTAEAGGT